MRGLAYVRINVTSSEQRQKVAHDEVGDGHADVFPRSFL
jgi:hypothetical protein